MTAAKTAENSARGHRDNLPYEAGDPGKPLASRCACPFQRQVNEIVFHLGNRQEGLQSQQIVRHGRNELINLDERRGQHEHDQQPEHAQQGE